MAEQKDRLCMIHQLWEAKGGNRRCWNNNLGCYCWWPAQWPRECERCCDGLYSKLLTFCGEFIPKTVQDRKHIAESKIHFYA